MKRKLKTKIVLGSWGEVRLHCMNHPIAFAIQRTGSKEEPTGICTDRTIETWKADNVESAQTMKQLTERHNRY